MTKVLLGKDGSGKFRMRVLESGANLINPNFNDILFDADFPVVRIFESGKVTVAARGSAVIGTTPIGGTPMVLAMLSGSAYIRSSYNDPGPGQITGPISYVGGRGTVTATFPYVILGEVFGALHGYQYVVQDARIDIVNYFWTVSRAFQYHLLAIDG